MLKLISRSGSSKTEFLKNNFNLLLDMNLTKSSCKDYSNRIGECPKSSMRDLIVKMSDGSRGQDQDYYDSLR